MIITPKQRTAMTITVCLLVIFVIAFIVLVIKGHMYGYIGALAGIACCVVRIGIISDEMNGYRD